jgi:hypothetical protein
VAATGARWVREDLDWALVQPAGDQPPQWASFDALVDHAAQRGLRVLPILGGTPCWAAPPGTPTAECPRSLPADAPAFGRFAAAAAARYGPGGSFWALRPRLDAGMAPAWLEVINEPYFAGSTATVDPARYALVFAEAVRAGRAANPAVRWLLATTTDARLADGSRADWAPAMAAAVADLGTLADGLAVHAYPGDRAPAGRVAAFVTDAARRVRDATGADLPVWVTELGYSACGPPAPARRCVPGDTTAAREERKARWLGDAITELVALAHVQAVFVYTLREWADPYFGQLGLLDPRLRGLPALEVVRRAAARSGDVPPPAFSWPPRDPLQVRAAA